MKKRKNKLNFIYKININHKLDFDIKKVSKSVVLEYKKLCKIDIPIKADITFVDNKMIRKINRKNRDIDKPTDVLSFPMGTYDLSDETYFLGDIIISIDKLIYQSKIYGHSLKREYAFLLTHSLLHLIGYDHMCKKDEKKMFNMQNKILKNININR